jgi:hypothetical protein
MTDGWLKRSTGLEQIPYQLRGKYRIFAGVFQAFTTVKNLYFPARRAFSTPLAIVPL